MSDFAARVDDVTSRIDDYGKPAWIALTVLAFIAFWPLGLGLLFFLIWSGRMGCGRYGRGSDWREDRRAHWDRKVQRMQEKMARWGGGPIRGFAPTGNRAFDEYREQMLARLENEAQEFQDYLARLRAARDKEEFDHYMADRQRRDQNPPPPPAAPQQPEPPRAG